jgi:PAS domain S-box-containing protein
MKISYSKITLTAILVIFMLILGIALFLFNWEIYKTEQVNHEFQLAKSVAASLPKELFKPLETEPADTSKFEYQILKSRLAEIATINTTARFTYLYTLRNNNLYFIAGSEPLTSKDYSPHGQGYPNAEPAFKRPFVSGNALVTDPWGNSQSVLVPLKDTFTGKTIAVFGMDFTLSILNRDLWIRMAGSFALLLILMITLLSLVRIRFKNRLLIIENKEHRELEKSLTEDKERFHSSFYNAPLCYQSLDAVGDIIDVNQQWTDTFGYAADEAIGKWFGSFLTPSYQDGFRNRFPIFKDRGKIYSEFEIVHKNSKTLFVSFDGRIGYHQNGAFKQAHCILQDITERTQTKNELTSSLSVLHASLESTAEGIIAVDREAKVVLHNVKFAEMWPMPKEILTNRENGDALNFIVSLMIKPEEFSFWLKELTEKPAESGTDFFTLSDGRIIEWYSQPQRIGEAIIGRVWSFRDITECKSAEKLLRQSEGMYSSIMAHISDTIVLMDKDCVIRYCSPNIEKLFGWKPVELIGTNYLENIHPNDSGLFRNEFARLIEIKNSIMTLEYRFKCSDGSYKLIAVRGLNLTNDTYIGSILISFHELTERLRAKEQLIKSGEKAEESGRSKSDFIANMSHDIRIPLNGILGFAELLNENGLTDEERREYTEIIRVSGARILDIINDIVKLSEIESGKK